MQLVEEGLNASKPGDISRAAANLITEMASTEQVRTLASSATCRRELLLSSASVLEKSNCTLAITVM